MSESAHQYFARVTAGLERVAWQDVERRTGARLLRFGHRRIDFSYDGPPHALLALRSVDDIYVWVGRLTGMDRARASLARLTQQLRQVDFAPAVALCAAVRPLRQPPTYRVTSSHLGKRNYSRYDVEGAVEAALSAVLPWRFVPNDPEEGEPDLDLRALIEDDWALIGLRLGRAPLHRRAYKVASQPGSLKAPVAYCLCLLAGLQPGDAVLDPACGAGTIMIEAAALVPGGVVIGGDRDSHAIARAQENLEAAGLAPRVVWANAAQAAGGAGHIPSGEAVVLYHCDVQALPLADRSIHAVVTNLPWGQQVAAEADLSQLYTDFLRTIVRVLAPGGWVVLLTDPADRFHAALAAMPGLLLESSFQISLFGRHPTVFVCVSA
ncbi:MAG TPA: methyltransferase domain-containing protein [Roseiflexaceae bacterium]